MAAMLLLLVGHMLRCDVHRSCGMLGRLLLVAVCMPIPLLVLTGTEHLAHAFVLLLAVSAGVDLIEREPVAAWRLLASMLWMALAVSLGYESLAGVVGLVLWAWIRRRFFAHRADGNGRPGRRRGHRRLSRHARAAVVAAAGVGVVVQRGHPVVGLELVGRGSCRRAHSRSLAAGRPGHDRLGHAMVAARAPELPGRRGPRARRVALRIPGDGRHSPADRAGRRASAVHGLPRAAGRGGHPAGPGQPAGRQSAPSAAVGLRYAVMAVFCMLPLAVAAVPAAAAMWTAPKASAVVYLRDRKMAAFVRSVFPRRHGGGERSGGAAYRNVGARARSGRGRSHGFRTASRRGDVSVESLAAGRFIHATGRLVPHRRLGAESPGAHVAGRPYASPRMAADVRLAFEDFLKRQPEGVEKACSFVETPPQNGRTAATRPRE